jgi:hypothetical protein
MPKFFAMNNTKEQEDWNKTKQGSHPYSSIRSMFVQGFKVHGTFKHP